jgi:sugar phosphate isomerase/epimerase
MMAHCLGVSGSVILSNPEQFSELFWDGIDHVEIGEFPTEAAFNEFFNLCNENGVSFGIHSPLYRNQSKYDLLQKVYDEPKTAWEQLEDEAKQLSALGADYILVHFPYFKDEIIGNVNEIIEQGLKRLDYLQRKYSIQIVCEPKLGFGCSAAGINYLHNLPIERWEEYNLKLCIDIRDYLIATEGNIIEYLSKWKRHIKVVHLHNVLFKENKYIWIPVHPLYENDVNHYKIEGLIRFLSECEDLIFVFEHTPHSNPSKEFVAEGYRWVRSIVDKQD